MTGNGPPRSGWVMKVVVLPSLVSISTWLSIMAVSLCCESAGFLGALNTIASKPEHDKARAGRRRALNRAARIAIVSGDGSRLRRFRHDPDQQPVFRRDRPADE